MYHTLNKLSVDVTRKVLVGEAWVPATSRVRVQDALRQVSEDSNSSVRPLTDPPVSFASCPRHCIPVLVHRVKRHALCDASPRMCGA